MNEYLFKNYKVKVIIKSRYLQRSKLYCFCFSTVSLNLIPSESSSWCQTEGTVRLAISAVVGMALVVLIVDYMRLQG